MTSLEKLAELAARKTLATKQNISEGCGAKPQEARAFLTSLLVTEKPEQFHGTVGRRLRRGQCFVDPAARQTARNARVALRPI